MNFWRVRYSPSACAPGTPRASRRSLRGMGWILMLAGLLFFFGSCAPVKDETSYKNPGTVLFHADKVLVVGMVSDYATRLRFESRIADAFAERGVEAVRSVDLFDVAFTATARSEEELDKVEQQLLDKDFDAILFSKRLDAETRMELSRQLAEMGRSYERFREDYIIHQGIYYDDVDGAGRQDYAAETSLYCICSGKERELIWRSSGRLPKSRNTRRVFDAYADWLIKRLEAQELIIGHEPF